MRWHGKFDYVKLVGWVIYILIVGRIGRICKSQLGMLCLSGRYVTYVRAYALHEPRSEKDWLADSERLRHES